MVENILYPLDVAKVNREKSSLSKKKNDKQAKENQKKSSLFKKISIQLDPWALSFIAAVSAVKLVEKLSSKDNDNTVVIEKSIDSNDYIDDNNLPSNNIIDVPDEDTNDDSNEDEIINDDSQNDSYEEQFNDSSTESIEQIDDKDTIDYQEEDNEYYYNLDGEVDRQNWNNAMRYEDAFKKAGEKYGIDYKLLMAIACQESSGIHKNNKYSYGIMHVEKVHEDEELAVNNMITGEVDTLKGTVEYLSSLYGNTEFGAGILQRCLNIAYREGYKKGILKKNEIIPVALHGYNMGFDAERELIDNYAKSGEESYNYFIRITISTNIEDEALVWHLKYPALVFNERGEENTEYWAYCKSSNGEIEKVFTTPINESKIFTASMKR